MVKVFFFILASYHYARIVLISNQTNVIKSGTTFYLDLFEKIVKKRSFK